MDHLRAPDQKETLSKYAAFNLEANTGPICSPHLFYNDKCCCLQTSSALLRNLSESTFQKGPEEGYDKVLQDVTSGRWPDSSDPGPLSGLEASSTRLSRSIPKNSHSEVLPVWMQLNNSQVPELTSAPSLWYRLSTLKLCQYNCLSKRAFVSKVVSGEELFFSPSLTICLHCYTVVVDLCLLNLGISTSNQNNFFKYCCFNAVTDPL
ncbi:uncharacterized protein [Aphelocoma coerulescens]|uniref:uncharacterized protein isoform X1 n=1 Tax=Aphelocoma coerulescens TaxID=39617 RepID=UPI003604DB37